MYGMGVGGEIDPSVKAIASFHGEIANVVNATVGIFGSEDSVETGYSSWGGGDGAWSAGSSNEVSEGGSWGSGEASGSSWGSTGGSEGINWESQGSSLSGSSNNTVPDEAPKYPWDQRSSYSNAQPQILIQSGVDADNMDDVAKLETMLISKSADYELTRFSGAQDDFTNWESSTYNPRATVRSFDQLESVLLEVFVAVDASTSTSDNVVSVPIEEITPNPAPSGGDQVAESEETEPASPAPTVSSGANFKYVPLNLGLIVMSTYVAVQL